MIGRRRPLARAAMVGGAGYMAGKHAAGNQAQEADQSQQIADQQQQIAQLQAQQSAAAPPPPPPPAPPAAPAAAPPPAADDLVGQIQQLKGLLDQGVLTQEEFDAAKQKLISG